MHCVEILLFGVWSNFSENESKAEKKRPTDPSTQPQKATQCQIQLFCLQIRQQATQTLPLHIIIIIINLAPTLLVLTMTSITTRIRSHLEKGR